MKRENKKEIYSVRKFKVGVGSALIGLSFLGATGALNDVPVVGDVLGVKEVHAESIPAYYEGKYVGDVTITRRPDGSAVYSIPPGYSYSGDPTNGHGPIELSRGGGGMTSMVTPPTDNSSYYNGNTTPNIKDENTTTLPYSTTYVADENMPAGERRTEVVGRNGSLKTWKERNTAPWTGSSVIYEDRQERVEPVNAVERVGVAPTITKTPINFETEYVADKTREKGQKDVTETEGRNGEIVKTIRHTLDRNTGVVNDLPAEETRTPATKKVVKVAAKDKVVSTPIASPKKYVKDETREKGQPNIEEKGKDGSTVTTTVYNVNPKNGAVTEAVGQPVRTAPTDTIIKVAAKTKVTTKGLPSRKVYVGDTTKDFGTPNVETAGRAGSEKTTVIYDVNPQNGTITERPNVERTEPTDTIVKVGTKTKVVTKKDDQGRDVTETTAYEVNRETGKVTPTTTVTYGSKASTVEKKVIPSPVRYEKDATREKGAENITVKGKDGEDSITTTYAVDPKTGKITPTVGKPVRTVKPTETVIKVAAKDKVETKELPNKTRYVADKERAKGTPNKTTTQGHPGREVTTTTYNVNPQTGDVTETTNTNRESEPVDTVISVGAKTTVETIKSGTKTIERTTVYDVNPETGKVTETVTDKLIGEVSAEPPVVEVPEFDTNTLPKEDVTEKETVVDENGSGLVNEKPAFDESKIKVVTEELQPSVRYEKDDSREKGQPNITVPGEVGQKKITTVPVPDENGAEKEVVTEEIVKPAGETVIKVATKTKVERIKDGTRTIERTTSYEVDPKTGAITETVTDKLISDMSAEPPVVDVPEFNGGVNGDLDGNPLINKKPEFDLSKLPKEDKPAPVLTDFNLGTGKNDFGPKKETPKVEVVPANFTAPRTEEVAPEKKADAPKVEAVSQTGNASATSQATNTNTANNASKAELPYTGTADNAALTLAGISLALIGVGLAVKKRD